MSVWLAYGLPMSERDTRRNLWKLHELADRIADAYEEAEGEVTDEIGDLETLMDITRDEALEGLAALVVQLKGHSATIKAEQDRLAAAQRRTRRAIEWAQAQALRLLGDDRTKTVGTYRLGTRRSTSVTVPSDEARLNDLAEMGMARKSTSIIPDKMAIKKAMTSGDLPSIQWADLGLDLVQKTTITIK